jgi:hypothetical protein
MKRKLLFLRPPLVKHLDNINLILIIFDQSAEPINYPDALQLMLKSDYQFSGFRLRGNDGQLIPHRHSRAGGNPDCSILGAPVSLCA